MAKKFAKAFYKSRSWRLCRESYIKERVAADGGLCEQCRERLGYYVHHTVLITPENINDPGVTLNHDLLEYVCKPCHDREEGHFLDRGDRGKARYSFDESGNPVPIRNS